MRTYDKDIETGVSKRVTDPLVSMSSFIQIGVIEDDAEMRKKSGFIVVVGSVAVSIGLAFGLIDGCAEHAEQKYADQVAVTTSVYRQVPALRRFLQTFPNAKPYVTLYSTKRHPDKEIFYLTAAGGLYNRYQLTMFIPLRLNAQKTDAVDFKQPRFVIREVEEVTQDYATYGPPRVFGVEDWNEATRAGDFSILIPGVVRTEPVPRFQRVYADRPQPSEAWGESWQHPWDD